MKTQNTTAKPYVLIAEVKFRNGLGLLEFQKTAYYVVQNAPADLANFDINNVPTWAKAINGSIKYGKRTAAKLPKTKTHYIDYNQVAQ